MDFKFKNGKYIINKDGVYFALTEEQIPELQELLKTIIPKYGCFANSVYPEYYPTCVWDTGDVQDCCLALEGIQKEDCECWRITNPVVEKIEGKND